MLLHTYSLSDIEKIAVYPIPYGHDFAFTWDEIQIQPITYSSVLVGLQKNDNLEFFFFTNLYDISAIGGIFNFYT